MSQEPITPPSGSPITLANSLQELAYAPNSIELFRRLYLWKYYLLGIFGTKHTSDINAVMAEVLRVCKGRDCKVVIAIEVVLSPAHYKHLIVHDHPQIAHQSVQYILHGVEEEVIPPWALEIGKEAAIEGMRQELNILLSLTAGNSL